MPAPTPQTEAIMLERFSQDSIIALATSVDHIPFVRNVDAFYQDGAFYVLTYALSGKMQQIAQNPVVALAGEWFTAHGVGENLGWFGSGENAHIAEKMRKAFAAWIDNGHNNFDDPNTVILRIRLTHAVLFSHGTRYELDYE
ncbi:MAG: pyridoxamine 5'-phosphate oxidase family protein [Clostridiales bacterium]|nr:pyridoxamine 5'-phosphate oxidase family protein [Clostridiales bacterium]